VIKWYTTEHIKRDFALIWAVKIKRRHFKNKSVVCLCVFVSRAYAFARHETSHFQAFAVVTSVVMQLEEVLRDNPSNAFEGE